MDLKCEKCDGETASTKYCTKCKKAFCHNVTTAKVVMKESNEAEFVDICPDCGAKDIINFKFNK